MDKKQFFAKCKKNGPFIGTVVGIACWGAASLFAYKAAKKKEVLNIQTEELLDIVEQDVNNGNISTEDGLSQKKAILKESLKDNIKIFAPSVASGVVGTSLILMSHNVMNKRLAIVTSAYTAVNTAYLNLKNKIKENYGEEEARRLDLGGEIVEVKNEVTDKDGKKKTKKEKEIVYMEDLGGYSPYAVMLSPESGSRIWTDSPAANKLFLVTLQARLNQELIAGRKKNAAGQHIVLYNDVLAELDLPLEGTASDRDDKFAFVGWKYDPDHPEKNTGDGHIDFGLFDGEGTSVRFMDGVENAVILDFNVDGIVL